MYHISQNQIKQLDAGVTDIRIYTSAGYYELEVKGKKQTKINDCIQAVLIESGNF
jgi:hypothetical protein